MGKSIKNDRYKESRKIALKIVDCVAANIVAALKNYIRILENDKKILPYFSYIKPVWFKFSVCFWNNLFHCKWISLPVMVEKVFQFFWKHI